MAPRPRRGCTHGCGSDPVDDCCCRVRLIHGHDSGEFVCACEPGALAVLNWHRGDRNGRGDSGKGRSIEGIGALSFRGDRMLEVNIDVK